MINKILIMNNQVDWELFISRHQEYSPAYAYLILASLTNKKWFQQTTRLPFDFKFAKRVGDDYYWSSSQANRLQELLKNNRNSYFYLQLIKNAESHCIELIKFSRKIKNKDFSKASNEELNDHFEEYWEKLRKAASFMWPKHKLSQVLEEKIKEKLKRIPETEANPLEIFDGILIPAKEAFFTKAQKELVAMTQDKYLSDIKISTWLENYSWIETFTWLGKPLQKAAIKKRLVTLKKEKLNDKKNNKDFCRKVLQKLKKYPVLVQDIKALQYLLYFHTFEPETLFFAHFLSNNLIKEITIRIGISIEEYPFTVYPEIVAALKGKRLDKKRLLSRRNNQYAIFLLSKRLTIIDGTRFRNMQQQKDDTTKQKVELHGHSACLGKVKGRAVIIYTVKDFKKLTKENIIIATMTTVEFTPYLKLVRAIVTDEGGITCHAAIVSRELKIPCIVGTKEATSILKDGDLIEVDAYHGLIKLLK